ncbi:MAG: DUF1479 family protein [Armatimonadaceae bacterium]
MRVLTEDDLRHLEEQGYLVVSNAVPPENLQAVIDTMFDFLGMDPNDPADWYREPLRTGGMVEMYQQQAMWDNRQHPKVHGIFADIFNNEKLWVTIDRVNLKPPQHPEYPEYDHKGFMHWDADVTRAAEMPFGVQGVLYLADTTEEMGGFQCAPGHHKVVMEWAKEKPREQGEKPDMTDVLVVPTPGKAGDLVIWNRFLYHGNGHNRSNKPRLAQYISMFPVPTGDRFEEQRKARIEAWESRKPLDAPWVVGDPREWEQKHSNPAQLTTLGRKLLGLDSWD